MRFEHWLLPVITYSRADLRSCVQLFDITCLALKTIVCPKYPFSEELSGLEDGRSQRERASMPAAPAISAWGCFGAGANSLQAHGPFTTPRHEQIEKHSPFPAPYMEQISGKKIIQPEGVIQIIPNRHGGGMLCWNPLIRHSWIDSDLPYIQCIRQLCRRPYSRWKATVTVTEPLCPVHCRRLPLRGCCRVVDASHTFDTEQQRKWNGMNPLQNAVAFISFHFWCLPCRHPQKSYSP